MPRDESYISYLNSCTENAAQQMDQLLNTQAGIAEEATRQQSVMQQIHNIQDSEKISLSRTEHLKYTG